REHRANQPKSGKIGGQRIPTIFIAVDHLYKLYQHAQFETNQIRGFKDFWGSVFWPKFVFL
ncbi:hypothetical protein, partial [Acinetobacter baumannii]|uniref:hypothetical protein n=1 Tax=Acinetobacter baumannii TaxID=470 RepID=UPI001C06FD14